jgi:hypothetical protein
MYRSVLSDLTLSDPVDAIELTNNDGVILLEESD